LLCSLKNPRYIYILSAVFSLACLALHPNFGFLQEQNTLHRIISALLTLFFGAYFSFSKKPFPQNLLRRFPYWAYGHRLFAESALLRDDVAAAYASTQAIIALRGETTVSDYLLGRCYLKRNLPEKAIEHLLRAHKQLPNDYEVIEEVVAGYIFLEQFDKAIEFLKIIPDERRSVEAVHLGQYLDEKLK
jgi:tetratricopeptide (TPR) repeat protein